MAVGGRGQAEQLWDSLRLHFRRKEQVQVQALSALHLHPSRCAPARMRQLACPACLPVPPSPTPHSPQKTTAPRSPKGQAHGAQVAAAVGGLCGCIPRLQQHTVGLQVEPAKGHVESCRGGERGGGSRRGGAVKRGGAAGWLAGWLAGQLAGGACACPACRAVFRRVPWVGRERPLDTSEHGSPCSPCCCRLALAPPCFPYHPLAKPSVPPHGSSCPSACGTSPGSGNPAGGGSGRALEPCPPPPTPGCLPASSGGTTPEVCSPP